MATIPFLCLLLSFFYASSPAVAADLDPFVPDYLKLTLVWPGQKCSDSTCCLPTTGEPALDFFVQDMQAYTLNSREPYTNCKMDPPCAFKINALAGNMSVITDLYNYWPDVNCPGNNGMDHWKSLWCTYGSCSNLTEYDYFVGALTLRGKLSLLTLLHDYGIVPSETETYKLKDVELAIAREFGVFPVLECTDQSKISKVHVCVSKATLIIQCLDIEKSNCGDEVIFYPFTYDMLEGYDDEVAAGGEGIIRKMSSA